MKIKRFFTFFMTFMMATVTTLPYAASAEASAFYEEDKHILVETAQKDASCTEAGYETYWTCEVCGKLFRDAEGTEEITEPEEIPVIAHTLTETEQKDASCTEAGCKAYWICEVCGKLFSDAYGTEEITEPEFIPATGHVLVEIVPKDASCTEEGYEEYWICTECWKMFIEEDGTYEIKEPIEIPATGHKLVETEQKAATCIEAGYKAYWTCEVCGKLFSDAEGTNEITEPEVIPVTGHTLKETAQKDATYTEAGYKAYWTCEVCKKLFSDAEGTNEITEPEVIPATGHHALIETVQKAVSCTEAGYKAYWTCEICGKLFSDAEGKTEITEPEEIPATGHVLTETVPKAASCTEVGYKAYWTCEVCGKLFRDAEGKTEIEKPIKIPATGHTLKKVAKKAATCKEAGYEAYWTCTKCGKLFSDAKGTKQIAKPIAIAKITAHKWVSAKASKKPTAKKAGKLKQTCSVCKKTRNINIPKTSITLSAQKGKTGKIAIAANSGWKVKLKKASQKKFITVNAKTGKITVKVKPANYKKIPKSILVVLTNGKYKCTVHVKLVIPAPKVSILKYLLPVDGDMYYRYLFIYNIPGADRLKVRVQEENSSELNFLLDQYISSPKSNPESYIRIRKSKVDKDGGKLTFVITAYYGKKSSKTKLKI